MFKLKSVDSVLKAFNTAIADLAEIVASNDKHINDNQRVVEIMNADSKARSEESTRAVAVAEKLKQLTSI